MNPVVFDSVEAPSNGGWERSVDNGGAADGVHRDDSMAAPSAFRLRPKKAPQVVNTVATPATTQVGGHPFKEETSFGGPKKYYDPASNSWSESTRDYFYAPGENAMDPASRRLAKLKARTDPDGILVKAGWEQVGDILEMTMDDGTFLKVMPSKAGGFNWEVLVQYEASLSTTPTRVASGCDDDVEVAKAAAQAAGATAQSKGGDVEGRLRPVVFADWRKTEWDPSGKKDGGQDVSAVEKKLSSFRHDVLDVERRKCWDAIEKGGNKAAQQRTIDDLNATDDKVISLGFELQENGWLDPQGKADKLISSWMDRRSRTAGDVKFSDVFKKPVADDIQHIKSSAAGDFLLEELSSLIHDEWISWSKTTAKLVPEEKRKSWEKNWVPYSELDEETKEYDRVWARKVMETLKERGVTASARTLVSELNVERLQGLVDKYMAKGYGKTEATQAAYDEWSKERRKAPRPAAPVAASYFTKQQLTNIARQNLVEKNVDVYGFKDPNSGQLEGCGIVFRADIYRISDAYVAFAADGHSEKVMQNRGQPSWLALKTLFVRADTGGSNLGLPTEQPPADENLAGDSDLDVTLGPDGYGSPAQNSVVEQDPATWQFPKKDDDRRLGPALTPDYNDIGRESMEYPMQGSLRPISFAAEEDWRQARQGGREWPVPGEWKFGKPKLLGVLKAYTGNPLQWAFVVEATGEVDYKVFFNLERLPNRANPKAPRVTFLKSSVKVMDWIVEPRQYSDLNSVGINYQAPSDVTASAASALAASAQLLQEAADLAVRNP